MINWFPGHMSKTLKELKAKSKLANLFIYVLDARCPKSCINPEFISIIKGKPIIYVLNKSDIADKEYITSVINELNNPKENVIAIPLDATKSNTSNLIVSNILKLMKTNIVKNESNNVKFVFRAMVIGVPNCGKSTLINNLLGKNVLKVGNKAGVTRQTSWAKINSTLEVMDTPGTLYPKISTDEIGYNLAFVGSINDDILDLVDLSYKLIERLINSKYSVIFQKKYDLNLSDYQDEEIVNEYGEVVKISFIKKIFIQIAKNRGAIIKGGEIDFERTAKIILTDFRSGKLGKISFY